MAVKTAKSLSARKSNIAQTVNEKESGGFLSAERGKEGKERRQW
jgi:hypothetical protein